jgi:hypothetical protein
LALLKRLQKVVVLANIHTKDNAPALAKVAKISLLIKETNTTTVVNTDSVVEKEDVLTPREVVDVPELNE